MSVKKIWLMGGFGNVLFQILAYNVIAKANNKVTFVAKLTERNIITKFLKWTIHQRLYDDLIQPEDVSNVGTLKSCYLVLLSFVSKKTNKKYKSATFYSDKTELKGEISHNVFGYFQDSNFLTKHQDELLKLGSQLRSLYAQNEKMIVVHYRKGDSGWAIKFASYYDKVKELLTQEKENILVVTDSIDDANVFFKEIKGLKVISSENALEDFKYLVSAKKIYCAPSTFSWWAAHSLSEESQVIMPSFLNENLGVYVKESQLTILD